MHPAARAQIRSARMSNGLSLRELGRRTGVTASLLSQIENGKSDPSVSTLTALVSELGLSLDAMLRPDWARIVNNVNSVDKVNSVNDAHDVIDGTQFGDLTGPEGLAEADLRGGDPQRAGRSLNGSLRGRSSPVIHPAERRTLDLDSGVVWERLTRSPSELLDTLLVTYQPGATSSSSGKLLRHGGIEHAYLISGELTLKLGFDSFRLEVGDSLEFDGATPHVYCNTGDVPARGLWFVLGKDSLPAQVGPHRLLHLAEAGARGLASPVDFLRAFAPD